MKRFFFLFLLLILLISCGNKDQKIKNNNTSFLTSESIEVGGSCGMCEDRIEGTLNKLDGVKEANYDLEKQILMVKFDSDKINSDKIQTALADAGHDTPMHKATTEKYDSLPGCCKYRK